MTSGIGKRHENFSNLSLEYCWKTEFLGKCYIISITLKRFTNYNEALVSLSVSSPKTKPWGSNTLMRIIESSLET